MEQIAFGDGHLLRTHFFYEVRDSSRNIGFSNERGAYPLYCHALIALRLARMWVRTAPVSVPQAMKL